MIYTKVYKS